MAQKTLPQSYGFKTERLIVEDWEAGIADSKDKNEFAKKVINILTDPVTKSLPDDWKGITDKRQALDWIDARADEGIFLTLQLQSTLELIGFLFLYESNESSDTFELRLGYLLSESAWGQGLGSELIEGLIEICEKHENIHSLAAGVEKDNIASIKILEKNGFNINSSDDKENEVVFFERKIEH